MNISVSGCPIIVKYGQHILQSLQIKGIMIYQPIVHTAAATKIRSIQLFEGSARKIYKSLGVHRIFQRGEGYLVSEGLNCSYFIKFYNFCQKNLQQLFRKSFQGWAKLVKGVVGSPLMCPLLRPLNYEDFFKFKTQAIPSNFSCSQKDLEMSCLFKKNIVSSCFQYAGHDQCLKTFQRFDSVASLRTQNFNPLVKNLLGVSRGDPKEALYAFLGFLFPPS